MLVLSRRTCEQIQVGQDITITVLRVTGQKVQIGIQAPRDVRVLRSELCVEPAQRGAAVDARQVCAGHA
jgi:carbon storage regulator CsrA